MKRIILILLLLLLTGCTSVNQVCHGSICVDVEIADDPDERAQGLMFRESLDENEGMLFVFEEEKPRTFWMKNTLIPLDMVWINKEKQIVGITTATPCEEDPCEVYPSGEPAQYVLEINAGRSEELGLSKGDILVF